MLRHCSWCLKDAETRAMEANAKMPVVCAECGSDLGYITWQELNKILEDLHFYKRMYLTNQEK